MTEEIPQFPQYQPPVNPKGIPLAPHPKYGSPLMKAIKLHFKGPKISSRQSKSRGLKSRKKAVKFY